MNITLSGKQILITGGTGALGSAFVNRALKAGGTVFFTYCRNEEAAEKLRQAGAKGFRVDLSKQENIAFFAENLGKEIDQLDGMIHNAAIVHDRTIQNMAEPDWDEVIAVNLTAVYRLTKRLLPLLSKRAASKIVTIVSRVGLRGGFGQANYAASKGGLIAMTKTLAKELGRKQIYVNGVNPGFMRSEMTSGLPAEIFEKQILASAVRQMSEPERVSDFLVYLMSDAFPAVTGQIFHLDSREV